MKTVQELIEQEYGIRTRYVLNQHADECMIAVTQLLFNDPNRIAWIVINLSANAVYISFDRTVTAAKGIYLTPNGGSYTAKWNEDFILTAVNIFGTAAVDNSAILTLEVFIT